MTSNHHTSGKKHDATLIWTEDVTKNSFKACLRELQNFDGKHQNVYVVCDLFQSKCYNCKTVKDLRLGTFYFSPFKAYA